MKLYKWKLGDIFFYKYWANRDYWVVGEILAIYHKKYGTFFTFQIIKTSKIRMIGSGFSLNSHMYNDAIKLSSNPSEDELLALVL